MRKNPHGVFDGHSADALQPAPHLHPEVVGLRRDLVEEEEPTSACGLAHGGPPGWTTRLDTLSGRAGFQGIAVLFRLGPVRVVGSTNDARFWHAGATRTGRRREGSRGT